MFTNDCKCKLYVLNLHHIRTITKQNDKMTTQSITSQSITPSMMNLLKRTSETKNKPLFQVVAEYQDQVKLVAFNKQKREWLKENEEETEFIQEDERCSFVK